MRARVLILLSGLLSIHFSLCGQTYIPALGATVKQFEFYLGVKMDPSDQHSFNDYRFYVITYIEKGGLLDKEGIRPPAVLTALYHDAVEPKTESELASWFEARVISGEETPIRIMPVYAFYRDYGSPLDKVFSMSRDKEIQLYTKLKARSLSAAPPGGRMTCISEDCKSDRLPKVYILENGSIICANALVSACTNCPTEMDHFSSSHCASDPADCPLRRAYLYDADQMNFRPIALTVQNGIVECPQVDKAPVQFVFTNKTGLLVPYTLSADNTIEIRLPSKMKMTVGPSVWKTVERMHITYESPSEDGYSEYIGQTQNLVPDGKGRALNADGQWIEGMFEQGVMDGEFVRVADNHKLIYNQGQLLRGGKPMCHCGMKLKPTELDMNQGLDQPAYEIESILPGSSAEQLGFRPGMKELIQLRLDEKIKFDLKTNIYSDKDRTRNTGKQLDHFLIGPCGGFVELQHWEKTINSFFGFAKLFYLSPLDGGEVEPYCMTGNCLNGQGTLFDGEKKITGTFTEGVINGEGETSMTNGDVYKGSFLNGRFHGNGVLYYADGGRYTGQFQDGLYHGQGERYYATGHTQKGQFYFGIFERGVVSTSSGEFITGIFPEGKYEGWYQVVNKKAAAPYEGEYYYSENRLVWERLRFPNANIVVITDYSDASVPTGRSRYFHPDGREDTALEAQYNTYRISTVSAIANDVPVDLTALMQKVYEATGFTMENTISSMGPEWQNYVPPAPEYKTEACGYCQGHGHVMIPPTTGVRQVTKEAGFGSDKYYYTGYESYSLGSPTQKTCPACKGKGTCTREVRRRK